MKLRILQLITRLPVGGAERLIVDIVRGLDPKRFEPLVCCIQDKGALAPEVEAAGIPLFCLDRMRSKRFDVRAVQDLTRLLRQERVSLVQSHLYHANLYGRLAGWRAKVPVIATVHNSYTRPKLHRRLINRLLARTSARVIAVSEDVQRDLMRYDGVPFSKIVTINNGVDVRRIDTSLNRQQARERLGIEPGVLAVGCVARLEEQKGHRYLLQAVPLLREFSLRVFFVGEGRLRGRLEEQAAKLGIADSVAFLGTRHDIAEILKAMDLFVAPSLWEGLSVALLEAMAAGLPVIASDVGGVSQVLGIDQYGVRVPPSNAQALADAITTLGRDAQRRMSLGARGQQHVRENFSLEAMMRELTAVYQEAVRAH